MNGRLMGMELWDGLSLGEQRLASSHESALSRSRPLLMRRPIIATSMKLLGHVFKIEESKGNQVEG